MIRKLEGTLRNLAIVGCLCLATNAQAAQQAQNADSIYAGVFGGLTILPDLDISSGGFSADLETDAGFNFGGVVGYKWAMGLRAEGEISYRQNDLDNIVGIPLNGEISAFAFMGNAWYDFQLGSPWIPYVGGGLGLASIAVDSSAFGVDDSDVVFAWQLGGGVGFEISPGIVISADYRYLGTTDAELDDDFGNRFDQEYSSHSFMLGFRGHF